MIQSSLMIMSVYGLKHLYGKDPVYIVFRIGGPDVLNTFYSFDDAQKFCNFYLKNSSSIFFSKSVFTKAKLIPQKLSIKSTTSIKNISKRVYLSTVEIQFLNNEIEEIEVISHSSIDEKFLLILKKYLPLKIARDILSKNLERSNPAKNLSM